MSDTARVPSSAYSCYERFSNARCSYHGTGTTTATTTTTTTTTTYNTTTPMKYSNRKGRLRFTTK